MGSAPVRSAASLIGLSLALVACGGAAGPGLSPLRAAVAGLCEAREAAARGEIEGAETIFWDRSHDELHRLAAQAQERDRAAAARVLQAKQLVESALASGSEGEELEELLQELVRAATDAAASLEEEVREC